MAMSSSRELPSASAGFQSVYVRGRARRPEDVTPPPQEISGYYGGGGPQWGIFSFRGLP